jgi:prepilin-type N-terminal cleavage/methylation domain-containing protein
MQRRISLITVRGEKGFTLIELILVIAILGVLTAISVKAFTENRRRSYDTQAINFMRDLLTAAETEAPKTFTTYSGEQKLDDYPQLQLNTGMKLTVANDAQDRVQFFIAHQGGEVGFYFWVPGPACAVNVDNGVTDQLGTPKPLPSDRIAPDMATLSEYDWTPFRAAVGL